MQLVARSVLVVFLALAMPIVPFLIIGELPGERWLSATDENALHFGVTGAGLLAADILLPVPSSIVGSMLGARLGWLPGWLWGWGGLVLGNLLGYGAGRMLLSRFAPDIPQTPTLLLLFLSRPVPILAEAITFTAGAEQMNFLRFVWVSTLGNGFYSLALAGNGAALLPDAIAGPGLILPMALPVAGWLIWRWQAGKKTIRRDRP